MKVVEDDRRLTLAGKGTYYVTIPMAMIKSLGWKKGEKKTIKLEKKRIVIKDYKP